MALPPAPVHLYDRAHVTRTSYFTLGLLSCCHLPPSIVRAPMWMFP